MKERVFIAGASGAIGRRLTGLLREEGYELVGLTRSAERARELERSGVEAVVGNVYDAAPLRDVLVVSRPTAVINLLTDLPRDSDGHLSAEVLARNAHVREVGTANLVAAALQADVETLISESIVWAYAPGPEPHCETDALDEQNKPSIATLERLTLDSPPLRGAVLRFGTLYGPGTWYESREGKFPLHVDAAAFATVLALKHGASGAFNILEDSSYADATKARSVLGWSPELRAGSAASW